MKSFSLERVSLSVQARISDQDCDHGGSERCGSWWREGRAEGERAEGPPAGVHRGGGELYEILSIYPNTKCYLAAAEAFLSQGHLSLPPLPPDTFGRKRRPPRQHPARRV